MSFTYIIFIQFNDFLEVISTYKELSVIRDNFTSYVLLISRLNLRVRTLIKKFLRQDYMVSFFKFLWQKQRKL